MAEKRKKESALAEKRVLFVCVHNSARSQMAEAFLKKLAGERLHVESAGLEPGILNSLAVAVMKEEGIDISRNKTKSVFEFLKEKKSYDFVITVCDESQAERCPVFPGRSLRVHWGFADPSRFSGSLEEKLEKTRVVRDAIKTKISAWIKETGI